MIEYLNHIIPIQEVAYYNYPAVNFALRDKMFWVVLFVSLFLLVTGSYEIIKEKIKEKINIKNWVTSIILLCCGLLSILIPGFMLDAYDKKVGKVDNYHVYTFFVEQDTTFLEYEEFEKDYYVIEEFKDHYLIKAIPIGQKENYDRVHNRTGQEEVFISTNNEILEQISKDNNINICFYISH